MNKNRQGPLPDRMATCNLDEKLLARKLGVKVRAIDQLIDGTTRKLRGRKRQALADALGMSPAECCALYARQRDVVAPVVAITTAVRALNFLLRYRFHSTTEGAEPWAAARDELSFAIEAMTRLQAGWFPEPAEKPAENRPKIRPLLKKPKKKKIAQVQVPVDEGKSQLL